MTKMDVLDLLLRKQGDRSLREFAAEAGCSASYLSEIYRGTRSPGKKIMAYLGLRKTRTVSIVYAKAERKRA